MNSEQTLAIVIRRVEFSETSYVATLFTETAGKITGLAKGARRPKSSFENALDLLCISRVMFLRKSNDAMDLLTEAKLERRFRAALKDGRRLYAGYYIAELLNSMSDERDPHPRLFRSAVSALIGLDGHADIVDAITRFELALLLDLGELPSLDACVECGTRLDSTVRLAFGLLAGGVLCRRCKAGQRHVVSMSPGAIALMKQMIGQVTETSVTAEQMLNNQGPRWESMASPARGELRGLMNQRMSHMLGKRPKLYPFLTTLR